MPLPKVEVVEARGCDAQPLDPCSSEDQLTLRSAVWADQRERFAAFEAALEVAATHPPRVDKSELTAWVGGISPQAGTATVVFHSVVEQYLDPAARERFAGAMAQLLAGASPRSPVAWLSLERASGEGAYGMAELGLAISPDPVRLLGHASYQALHSRSRDQIARIKGCKPADNWFDIVGAVMDLPDDLELPLDRGAPWFYWLGGRPALDFVNTRRERWWRDVETLVTPEDLADWVIQAELLTHLPEVEAPLVVAARELREAVNVACTSCLEGSPVPVDAARVINVWLPYAGVPQSLQLDDQGVPVLGLQAPPDEGRHALGLIALDAAQMLGTPQRDRIRVCASETCSARFFDRSRAGRRRWCSMEGCGNVAKARRHRARQAGGGRRP